GTGPGRFLELAGESDRVRPSAITASVRCVPSAPGAVTGADGGLDELVGQSSQGERPAVDVAGVTVVDVLHAQRPRAVGGRVRQVGRVGRDHVAAEVQERGALQPGRLAVRSDQVDHQVTAVAVADVHVDGRAARRVALAPGDLDGAGDRARVRDVDIRAVGDRLAFGRLRLGVRVRV